MLNKKNLKCEEIQEIIHNNPDSRSEFENHIKVCPDCRLDILIHNELNITDNNLPLIPVDDITRRSIINSVVENIDECGSINEIPVKVRKGKYVQLMFAAAAIMGIIISGYAVFHGFKKTTSVPEVKEGKVLLISDITLSSTGNSVISGTKIKTLKSPAVITVGGIARILIYPESELKIAESSTERVVVTLNKGSILNIVDRKNGDPVFSVMTDNSRTLVVGTIFEVKKEQSSDKISVIRGKVKVTGKNNITEFVSSSMAVNTAEMKRTGLGEKELAILSLRLRLAEKFSETGNGVLEIESSPSGARVIHDGLSIGYTPLAFSLKPGLQNIQMMLNGYDDWEKTVEVRQGRNFLSAHLKTETVLSDSNPVKKSDIIETEDDFPVFMPLDVKKSEGKQKINSKRTHVSSVEPAKGKDVKETQKSEIPQTMVVDKEKDIVVVEKIVQKKELTAIELFREARKLKLHKNWRQAILLYKKLNNIYPEHNLSVISLVSMAEIQLEQLNDPASAKLNYSKYLQKSPGGILAKEAAWGLVRVYRKQGASSEERKALKSFIKNYPDALQVPTARKRLIDLGTK